MFGFNDPFGHMNSIMSQFMMDPFAAPGQRQQRQQPSSRSNNNNQVSLRNDPYDPLGSMSLMHHNPFSLMNQMSQMNQMSHMNHMGHMMGNFDNVFRNFEHGSAEPNNSQVFSSSSVITYSNADGKPKIYQQSKQVQQGPGGVKETREMVRDSERGIEKVAIGHHIGDRAHVIERQKQNGQVEETVNLENLDDDEVNSFNQEFESKLASHVRSSHNHYNGHRQHHHLNNNQPLAIEDNRSKKDKERKSKSKSKH